MIDIVGQHHAMNTYLSTYLGKYLGRKVPKVLGHFLAVAILKKILEMKSGRRLQQHSKQLLKKGSETLRVPKRY